MVRLPCGKLHMYTVTGRTRKTPCEDVSLNPELLMSCNQSSQPTSQPHNLVLAERGCHVSE